MVKHIPCLHLAPRALVGPWATSAPRCLYHYEYTCFTHCWTYFSDLLCFSFRNTYSLTPKPRISSLNLSINRGILPNSILNWSPCIITCALMFNLVASLSHGITTLWGVLGRKSVQKLVYRHIWAQNMSCFVLYVTLRLDVGEGVKLVTHCGSVY